jgi:hypothetical protein
MYLRKKRRSLFVILLFTVFLCSAQETSKPKPKFKTGNDYDMYLGFCFSPDMAYRHLKNNDGTSTSADLISQYNNIDAPKFGFTGGITFCYMYNKLFGFETGIQYSNKGFQTKNNSLYYDIADPRRGWTYNGNSTPPSTGKVIYTYNSTDVPIKLVCLAGKNRIRFAGSVGLIVTTLFRLREHFTGTDSNGAPMTKTVIKSSYINPIQFFPVISAGIDYRLSEFMFLKIEPIVRYGIRQDIANSSPIGIHLWNAGINFTYYIGF